MCDIFLSLFFLILKFLTFFTSDRPSAETQISDVPEVLNVHVNESKKNLLFLETFFSSSEKLTFEKENVIFFNTFLNFNLFYLNVFIFL